MHRGGGGAVPAPTHAHHRPRADPTPPPCCPTAGPRQAHHPQGRTAPSIHKVGLGERMRMGTACALPSPMPARMSHTAAQDCHTRTSAGTRPAHPSRKGLRHTSRTRAAPHESHEGCATRGARGLRHTRRTRAAPRAGTSMPQYLPTLLPAIFCRSPLPACSPHPSALNTVTQCCTTPTRPCPRRSSAWVRLTSAVVSRLQMQPTAAAAESPITARPP